MPLAPRQRVAVRTLEECRDRFVEGVLVVGRPEGACDRAPLGIADVLGDLVAERALAEWREALAQGIEVRTGTYILRPERIDVAEKAFVNQCRETVQLQQRVLERRRG